MAHSTGFWICFVCAGSPALEQQLDWADMTRAPVKTGLGFEPSFDTLYAEDAFDEMASVIELNSVIRLQAQART
jgi:hypothetical protein